MMEPGQPNFVCMVTHTTSRCASRSMSALCAGDLTRTPEQGHMIQINGGVYSASSFAGGYSTELGRARSARAWCRMSSYKRVKGKAWCRMSPPFTCAPGATHMHVRRRNESQRHRSSHGAVSKLSSLARCLRREGCVGACTRSGSDVKALCEVPFESGWG